MNLRPVRRKRRRSTKQRPHKKRKRPSSKYVGVKRKELISKPARFEVTVSVGGGKKAVYGGIFDTAIEAARRVNMICDEQGIPRKNPHVPMEDKANVLKYASSNYVGVCKRKNQRGFQVSIRIGGVCKYGGTFNSEIEAARKVNKMCDQAGIPHKNPGLGTGREQASKKKHQVLKGVSWFARDSKWQAYVRIDKKPIYCGMFADQEEAGHHINLMCQKHGVPVKNPQLGDPTQKIKEDFAAREKSRKKKLESKKKELSSADNKESIQKANESGDPADDSDITEESSDSSTEDSDEEEPSSSEEEAFLDESDSIEEESESEDADAENSDEIRCMICGEAGVDNLLICQYAKGRKHGVHAKCLGLSGIPKDKWYCPHHIGNCVKKYTGVEVVSGKKRKRYKAMVSHEVKRYYCGIYLFPSWAAYAINVKCDELGIPRKNPSVDKQPQGFRKELRTWASNRVSNYFGVRWIPQSKKWRATVYHKGKEVVVGDYQNEKRAATAVKNKYYELGIKTKTDEEENSASFKCVKSRVYKGETRYVASFTHDKQWYNGGTYSSAIYAAYGANLKCDELGIPRKNPSVKDMPIGFKKMPMGRRYATPAKNQDLESADTSIPKDNVEPVRCMKCKSTYERQFLLCDYDNGIMHGGHSYCFGLSTIPEGKWYCPDHQGACPRAETKPIKTEPKENTIRSCMKCNRSTGIFLLCDHPGVPEHGGHFECFGLPEVPLGLWYCPEHKKLHPEASSVKSEVDPPALPEKKQKPMPSTRPFSKPVKIEPDQLEIDETPGPELSVPQKRKKSESADDDPPKKKCKLDAKKIPNNAMSGKAYRYVGVVDMANGEWHGYGYVESEGKLLGKGNTEEDCAKQVRKKVEELEAKGLSVKKPYGSKRSFRQKGFGIKAEASQEDAIPQTPTSSSQKLPSTRMLPKPSLGPRTSAKQSSKGIEVKSEPTQGNGKPAPPPKPSSQNLSSTKELPKSSVGPRTSLAKTSEVDSTTEVKKVSVPNFSDSDSESETLDVSGYVPPKKRKKSIAENTPPKKKQRKEESKAAETKKSGYKNVYWVASHKTWRGIVSHKGKQYFCGYFADPEKAARAVNKKCIELGIPIRNALLLKEKSSLPKKKYVGVCWNKKVKKWKAGFMDNKKPYYCGCFADDVEAARAINAKCKELGIPLKNPEVENYPTTQHPGVYWNPELKKWKAALHCDGRMIHLGYFQKEIDAAKAVKTTGKERGINVVNPTMKYAYGSSSIYRGVSWNKADKKWKAGIRHNRKLYHIGNFLDEEEAARAVNAKCEELGIEKKNPLVGKQSTDGEVNKKDYRFIGVVWCKSINSWKASGIVDHRQTTLFKASTEHECAKGAREHVKNLRAEGKDVLRDYGSLRKPKLPVQKKKEKKTEKKMKKDSPKPKSIAVSEAELRKMKSNYRFIGVTYSSSVNKWTAYGYVEGKQVLFTNGLTEDDCAKRTREKVKKLRAQGSNVHRDYGSLRPGAKPSKNGGTSTPEASIGKEASQADVRKQKEAGNSRTKENDQANAQNEVEAIDSHQGYRYIGVTLTRRKNIMWQGRGYVDGVHKYLGNGQTEEECARVVREHCQMLLEKGHDLSNNYGHIRPELLSAEKARFKSKYVGVSWCSRDKRWVAKITMDKKKYYLGIYKSDEKAARAVNKKCKELGIPIKNPGLVEDANQEASSVNEDKEKKNSRYIGVTFYPSTKRWWGYGQVDGKRRSLGFGETEEECAKNVRTEVEKLKAEGCEVLEAYGSLRNDVKVVECKYHGVDWNKHMKKWEARVIVKSTEYYLGLFEDQKSAAKAVNEACKKHGIEIRNPDVEAKVAKKPVIAPAKAFIEEDDEKQAEEDEDKKQSTHQSVQSEIGTTSKKESSYIGVCKLKNGMWKAQIYYDKKTHYIGTYQTDYEAAQAVNAACEERSIPPKNPGVGSKAEDLKENIDSVQDEVDAAPAHKRGSTKNDVVGYEKKSKYVGVYFNQLSKKWGTRVYYDGKSARIGTFQTELEAARAVNLYCKEKGLKWKNPDVGLPISNEVESKESLSSVVNKRSNNKGDSQKSVDEIDDKATSRLELPPSQRSPSPVFTFASSSNASAKEADDNESEESPNLESNDPSPWDDLEFITDVSESEDESGMKSEVASSHESDSDVMDLDLPEDPKKLLELHTKLSDKYKFLCELLELMEDEERDTETSGEANEGDAL